MSVTSTTLAGVNVWQFSGAVTDAEINTAWAALITNGVYVINRAIYLDQTADISGVTGGFLVDHGTAVLPAFILDTRRDKTKSTFRNFTFLQRTGLTVPQRVGFVQTWNGTAFANQGAGLGTDGLSLRGGGFVYGVPGAGTGGDPRFLNEMPFTGLELATIYSQEFTEQELQVCVASSNTIKGITFEKAYGFPQIGTPTAPVNVVVYRSTQNTQSTVNGGLIPIRIFPSGNRYGSVCYVDSYVTRNNADINTRLIDTFGANASNVATIMVLNNYTRESWFGAAKTNIPVTTWAATNFMWGGVLKKLRFVGGDGATIRCYDSRSTTAAQKCAFVESGTSDFLTTSLAPTTDSNGQISLVHIGALAQGTGAPITRYTGQKYTFQKFGYRVSVTDIDMTQGGDNDLSAFTPVIPVEQEGIARTQAAINAATVLTGFQDLLEELHVLAIGLVGAASYSGAFGGNLFTFVGGVLTTSFSAVNVDATAAAKISFNSGTNVLTVKASELTSNSTVTEWINSGAVNLLNGAKIQGLYTTSTGPSVTVRLQAVSATAVAAIWHPTTSATELFQTNNTGSATAYEIYYPPGSVGLVKNYARELYGSQRVAGSITLAAGLNVVSFVDIPDVGIAQTTLATVQAYTTLENPDKFYDATAAFRLSEQGIKQGQMVTREGTSLNIGNFSHLINHNAAAVYSLTGSVITTKSSVYELGSKYVKEIATPPATITAHTNEIITISIEDANGNSQATVAGTVNSLVDVWKITNATPVADFATGTKIASDIGNGAYRFIAVDGFKLVFNNKDNGVYRYCSMSKGDYTVGWYLYDSPTGGLTQEQGDVLSSISLKTTDTFNDVNSLMTGFVESTDSLHALRGAVDATPAATATAVWSAETRTLTSAGSSGATLAEIEASTVLAKATEVAGVPAAVRSELATELARLDVAVSTRSTLTPEDIPEGLTAAQVRTELATELARLDVAVSTRSTLTAEDVPEGLTAAEVWANPERTLTEAPGLTTGQAEQLRKVAQLHGVGVDLVVTETSRTAGDVSQTLTTDEAGSTTVSAA